MEDPVTMKDFYEEFIRIDRRIALIWEKEVTKDKANDKQSSQSKKEKRSYPEPGKTTRRNNKKGQIAQSGTSRPQENNGPDI